MKRRHLSTYLGLTIVSVCVFAYAEDGQSQEQDRLDYLLHCSGCHLPTGEGARGVRGLTELGEIVSRPGGRSYLVQIPDASQAPVTDANLARITNWILQEFNADSLPSDFMPITEDEVRVARRGALFDPRKRRAEILSQPQSR